MGLEGKPPEKPATEDDIQAAKNELRKVFSPLLDALTQYGFPPQLKQHFLDELVEGSDLALERLQRVSKQPTSGEEDIQYATEQLSDKYEAVIPKEVGSSVESNHQEVFLKLIVHAAEPVIRNFHTKIKEKSKPSW